MATVLIVVALFAAACGGGGSQGDGTTLVVSGVSVVNGNVLVSGVTSLPDTARISVTLDLWERPEAEPDISVSSVATVSEGAFRIKIFPPQIPEFSQGPYELTLTFSPLQQMADVLYQVGPSGQKLTGPLVVVVGNQNTLRLVEKKDIQIPLIARSFTFQEPSQFQEESAQRALAEYMRAWKDRDWEAMVAFSERTWVSEQTNPTRLIESYYGDRSLVGFEIKGVEDVSDLLIRITFVAQWETDKRQLVEKEITVNVIKRALQSTTGERVQWGVDPLSSLNTRDVD